MSTFIFYSLFSVAAFIIFILLGVLSGRNRKIADLVQINSNLNKNYYKLIDKKSTYSYEKDYITALENSESFRKMSQALSVTNGELLLQVNDLQNIVERNKIVNSGYLVALEDADEKKKYYLTYINKLLDHVCALSLSNYAGAHNVAWLINEVKEHTAKKNARHITAHVG